MVQDLYILRVSVNKFLRSPSGMEAKHPACMAVSAGYWPGINENSGMNQGAGEPSFGMYRGGSIKWLTVARSAARYPPGCISTPSISSRMIFVIFGVFPIQPECVRELSRGQREAPRYER